MFVKTILLLIKIVILLFCHLSYHFAFVVEIYFLILKLKEKRRKKSENLISRKSSVISETITEGETLEINNQVFLFHQLSTIRTLHMFSGSVPP